MWLRNTWILPLLWAAFAASAYAQTWSLKAQTVRVEALELHRITATIDLDDHTLRLSKFSSDISVAGQVLPRVRGSANVRAPKESAQWRGELALQPHDGPRLRGDWRLGGEGELDVRVAGGAMRLEVEKGRRWVFRLKQFPLKDWQKLLADLSGWPVQSLQGLIDLQIHGQPGQPLRASGKLQDGQLDTSDGLRAAAALNADFDVVWQQSVKADLRLRSGELLWSPFYAQIPADGLTVGLERRSDAWQISAEQSNVAVIALTWPRDGQQPWSLQAKLSDLHETFSRYLSSYWEAQGFPSLLARGSATVSVVGSGESLDSLKLNAHATAVTLAQLQAEDLRVDLNWRQQSGAVQLSWDALGLGQVRIGGSAWAADFRDGRWQNRADLVLELLQGSARLAGLDLAMVGGQWQLNTALELQGLDLASLSSALGWVELKGDLSASFPRVQLSADQLKLHGGANINAFGGSANLAEVEIDRPFSVAPELKLSASFRALDLTELTSTFDFGEISGRLDGEIDALRMVAGTPKAFAASFRSTPGYRGERKISQRAVNNLSSVGGAGGGALSRSVLRVFDSFRYDAIGIGCRLSQGTCQMSGLEDAQGGYLIVRGSGLPRITVVGHAHRVDWDTLLARLQAATSGGPPTVR